MTARAAATSSSSTYSGPGSPAIVLTASPYNAAGDGRYIADAAITSGQATLTSATAGFVAGDVGKVVLVQGAAASNQDLRATISARTNSTTVTLSGNAGATVTGANAVYGTDDTAAIQAAIDSLALTGGTIYGGKKCYIVDGALRTTLSAAALGSTTGLKWYTQLVLPQRSVTDYDKVTIRFLGDFPMGKMHGVGGYGGVNANPITAPGFILQSTRTGGVWDATQGNPSVLAGPSWKSGDTSGFTNVLVVCENMAIRCPTDPSYAAMDFTGVAQAHVIDCMVDTLSPVPANAPTHYTGQGVLMPKINNNAPSEIKNTNVVGYYAAFSPGEHTTAEGIVAVLCYCGISVQPTGHLVKITHASIEQCVYGVAYADFAAGMTNVSPAVYDAALDFEDGGKTGEPAWGAPTYHLWEFGNTSLKGSLRYMISNSSSDWIVNGSANDQVVNMKSSVTVHLVGGASEPAFQNGWANYGNNYAPISFYKDQLGEVHLRGTAAGIGGQATMFTLPTGFRPVSGKDRLMSPSKGLAAGDGVTAIFVRVTSAGAVTPLQSVAANEILSFDDIPPFKAGI